MQNPPVSEARLAELTERARGRVKGLDPTFFEFTTALAFLQFAEQAVDLAVVEVGLGGRFDATNTVSSLVSVITNIDYDHQQFLGKRIGQIAYEKAGIIRPDVPVVTAASRPAASKVIRTKWAAQRPLYRLGEEFSVRTSVLLFRLSRIGNASPGFLVLCRVVTRFNAALALAAVELLTGRAGKNGCDHSRSFETIWEGGWRWSRRASLGPGRPISRRRRGFKTVSR